MLVWFTGDLQPAPMMVVGRSSQARASDPSSGLDGKDLHAGGVVVHVVASQEVG
jgi:hypothetical protein